MLCWKSCRDSNGNTYKPGKKGLLHSRFSSFSIFFHLCLGLSDWNSNGFGAGQSWLPFRQILSQWRPKMNWWVSYLSFRLAKRWQRLSKARTVGQFLQLTESQAGPDDLRFANCSGNGLVALKLFPPYTSQDAHLDFLELVSCQQPPRDGMVLLLVEVGQLDRLPAGILEKSFREEALSSCAHYQKIRTAARPCMHLAYNSSLLRRGGKVQKVSPQKHPH